MCEQFESEIHAESLKINLKISCSDDKKDTSDIYIDALKEVADSLLVHIDNVEKENHDLRYKALSEILSTIAEFEIRTSAIYEGEISEADMIEIVVKMLKDSGYLNKIVFMDPHKLN